MLKTVIVDFDGLIVDTETVWYHIFVKWFQENKGYDLSMEEFLICVGSNSEDLFREMEKKGVLVDREQFRQDTQRSFIDISSALPAKEGVEDFLRQSKEGGLQVTLATSSKRMKPMAHLERLDLMKYFDFLITAEDVLHIKPAPDLFLEAARRTDSRPEECLVVEDSLNGLKAGLNAGMRVLVVPNEVTCHSNFEGQYRMASSLMDVDVPELIENF